MGTWPNPGVTRGPGQHLCPRPCPSASTTLPGSRERPCLPRMLVGKPTAPPPPQAFPDGPETAGLLHLPRAGVAACPPVPVAPAPSTVPGRWEVLHKGWSRDRCSQTCLPWVLASTSRVLGPQPPSLCGRHQREDRRTDRAVPTQVAIPCHLLAAALRALLLLRIKAAHKATGTVAGIARVDPGPGTDSPSHLGKQFSPEIGRVKLNGELCRISLVRKVPEILSFPGSFVSACQ